MSRPNILLITSDQQHFDTIGLNNPKIKTPHLDRLAKEGALLNRAYCPNPTCTPTRASIITGMYPSQHGAWSLGTKLLEDVPTVGEEFQKAGYATHLIGKAHFQPLASTDEYESLECPEKLRDLDFWKDFTGPWYGFDHIELARNHGDEAWVGQHYALWLEEKGLSDWKDYFQPYQGEDPGKYTPRTSLPERYWEREEMHWKLPEELHYSSWTAERTIANIKEAVAEGKPFFTWSSFHDPHPPYVCPEPWASMYDPKDMEPGQYVEGEFEDKPPFFAKTREAKPDMSEWQETGFSNHGMHGHKRNYEDMQKEMAIYYGMTSLMDHCIGQILDALDELDIADNTLIVFTSDHGHFIGQHGLIAKSPMLYEDVVRVPFLVRYPESVPAGQDLDALVDLTDLAPSFLSAAGLEIPVQMTGVDQTAVWKGEESSARSIAICEHRHQPTKLQIRSYISDRYKLTLHRDRDYGEFYDLKEDPNEYKNLFHDPAAQSTIRTFMEEALQQEMRREQMRMPRVCGA